MNLRQTAPMTCACSLPDPQLRERVQQLERTVGAKVAAVRELDDGFELAFEPEKGLAEELGRFIEFESECCPFLDFSLGVRPGRDRVRLSLRGPDDAKDFLRPLLEQWRG